jgi:hypothetical protein
MRILEVAADPNAQRLAALTQFLLGRSEDTAAAKKISTDAYLKLAGDMGISLTKSQLIDMVQHPPLSNLITNVENDEIIFKGAETAPDTMSVDQARKTVDSMAKRAAKKGV